MDFGRNNMQGEYKKSSLFVFIDEPQQFLYKRVEKRRFLTDVGCWNEPQQFLYKRVEIEAIFNRC